MLLCPHTLGHIMFCLEETVFSIWLHENRPDKQNIFPADHAYLGPEHSAVQLTGALLVSQLKLQRSQSS